MLSLAAFADPMGFSVLLPFVNPCVSLSGLRVQTYK